MVTGENRIRKLRFIAIPKALVIRISQGTCTRGDIIIHNNFAFARHIPQRGLKNNMTRRIFKNVVLELDEAQTNLRCRVTLFLFARLDGTILLVVFIDKL